MLQYFCNETGGNLSICESNSNDQKPFFVAKNKFLFHVSHVRFVVDCRFLTVSGFSVLVARFGQLKHIFQNFKWFFVTQLTNPYRKTGYLQKQLSIFKTDRLGLYYDFYFSTQKMLFPNVLFKSYFLSHSIF